MSAVVTAYLWLSVIVWGSACVTAVRFDDHLHVRIFRAVMAIVPAGCLAWQAI